MWKDTITLIDETKTTNSIGDVINQRVETTIFANVKSIRQSEFYQAMAQGIRPEKMFEVRTHDYDNQPLIKHDETEMKVIRTYQPGDEITELICQGVV